MTFDGASSLYRTGALVYMGSYDGFVYALDAASGAVAWRAATGGEVRSSVTPSADGTLVFVGSSDGYLYAFDAARYASDDVA
jgi:outer membrane protein assembly factor BamB